MKTVTGDLIALAQAGRFNLIAHGCNCHCTMGAGIAKGIKAAFPAAWDPDRSTKSGERTKLGNCTAVTVALVTGNRVVVNDAVNAWGELFAPLADAILTQVLTSRVVHADASRQRLQAEGSCDRIHLWTILDYGQVAYRVTEDQRHARAKELIPVDFSGRLVNGSTSSLNDGFPAPGSRTNILGHASRPSTSGKSRMR
jgi:Transposase IS66 family